MTRLPFCASDSATRRIEPTRAGGESGTTRQKIAAAAIAAAAIASHSARQLQAAMSRGAASSARAPPVGM